MIRKFHLYLADLNPSYGTEPGKSRPVVIIQSDALNEIHSSTIICPLTTNIKDARILRVFIPASHTSGLKKDSDIMLDQIKAIDNKRFKKHLGRLNDAQSKELLERLNILINE